MIQANELRIGNYFIVAGKLICATYDDIKKCQRLPTLRRPITLTPEILEKCGFVKIAGYYSFEQILITDKWVEIRGYNHDYNGIIIEKDNCQYLHQLQNLYYCLTGKELEVTL